MSAKAVVTAFEAMREACPEYQGIKDSPGDDQCTHRDNESCGRWCAMDACPLLRAEARSRSLGWD